MKKHLGYALLKGNNVPGTPSDIGKHDLLTGYQSSQCTGNSNDPNETKESRSKDEISRKAYEQAIANMKDEDKASQKTYEEFLKKHEEHKFSFNVQTTVKNESEQYQDFILKQMEMKVTKTEEVADSPDNKSSDNKVSEDNKKTSFVQNFKEKVKKIKPVPFNEKVSYKQLLNNQESSYKSYGSL